MGAFKRYRPGNRFRQVCGNRFSVCRRRRTGSTATTDIKPNTARGGQCYDKADNQRRRDAAAAAAGSWFPGVFGLPIGRYSELDRGSGIRFFFAAHGYVKETDIDFGRCATVEGDHLDPLDIGLVKRNFLYLLEVIAHKSWRPVI